MAISRRQGLLLGAGLVGLAGAAAVWRLSIPAEDRLLAGLVDPDGAARIGVRLLDAAVPPVDEAATRARLATLARELPQEADALRAALAERITDEFRAGELVEVEAWFLARTEADLALLAAWRRAA
jgi:hypothetical protein